jgi:hypothetical protein
MEIDSLIHVPYLNFLGHPGCSNMRYQYSLIRAYQGLIAPRQSGGDTRGIANRAPGRTGFPVRLLSVFSPYFKAKRGLTTNILT